jgi:hypothetical protein
MPPQLTSQGLSVTLPSGWEARITRRPVTSSGERTFPVLHFASFPLPDHRDDFGGNVTSNMRSSDVFVTLFEYGPESVGQPLFAARGVPRLRADMFAAQRLQRPLRGQVGCQLFFTQGDRAFCLYVVAGSRVSLPQSIARVNTALDALRIERRSG